MYSVGDKIVHPMHGAGVIEEITQERINGVLNYYYVFTMPVGALTLKLPTENCSTIGVRGLSEPSFIDSVLAAIPGMSVDMTPNWNRRYRENMDKLKSGDLFEVAKVIKCLVRRDVQRGLSNGERKMLHSAKQILLSEMVLVKDMLYPEAEEWLLQTIMAEDEL